MDNQKEAVSLPKEEKNESGLLAFVYDMADPNLPVMTQSVAISDLRNNTTPLTARPSQSQWVYEGVLNVPRDGKYLFMVDQHNTPLSLEINQQKIDLSQQQIADGITVNHLKSGEQYPIRFTAITDGLVPQFRFYWDAGNGFEVVPDHVLHHPQHREASNINTTPLDHPQNEAINTIIVHEVEQKKLQLGYYKNRGRVAVIRDDSALLAALSHQGPTDSKMGNTAFQLISWLAGKPRIAHESRKTYLLSALDTEQFSGFDFHTKHNLFVDSFNSPHHWQDNDHRAAEQLADALLPSGEWHRHYDIVVLPANANQQQVALIRHWMELTGGSVFILHSPTHHVPSLAIQQLISDIHPQQNHEEHVTIPAVTLKRKGLQVTVSDWDPLTNETTRVAEYMLSANSNDPLPARSRPTQWLFSGVVTAPEDGDLWLTSRGSEPFSYQINSVSHIQDPESNQVHNIKSGESYPIQATIMTQGEVPHFALYWQLACHGEDYKPVPDDALEYDIADVQVSSDPIPTITEPSLRQSHYQQTIQLPSTSINTLNLTEEMLAQTEYFSLTLHTPEATTPFILEDIPLSSHPSWQSLVQEIEQHINQRITDHVDTRVSVRYQNNHIIIQGDDVYFTQFQLKQNRPTAHISINPTHIASTEDENGTTHTFKLYANSLKELTHLSLSLAGETDKRVHLLKNEFKSPDLPITSSEQFVAQLQHYLRSQAQTQSLHVSYDENQQALSLFDPLKRSLENFNLGLQHQTLPFVIAENHREEAASLIIGAITGKLPTHPDVIEYRLLEEPTFGKVRLNHQTGEWLYQANSDSPFSGSDQFDFIAILKNGQYSAPMSIQLQSDDAPVTNYPGKRVFTLPDPIYHEPAARGNHVPVDMQVHTIQLAQTHLQSPDTPYFVLTANRWALLKVDITSPSSANAPDITAVVMDKDDQEIGRIRLTGPENLPQQLPVIPNTPTIKSHELHQQSYTAPLQGQWIQPGMKLQLLVGDTPVVMPYTDHHGIFTPQISTSNDMVSRVTNHSLYRHGQGVYAYSPLSWGMEAAAKLPTTAFTLYSYPALSQFLPLEPQITHRAALFMPTYDRLSGLYPHHSEQISWGSHRSIETSRTNGLDSDFNYYSLTPTGVSSLLGLAWKNQGSGVAYANVMWHEVYGHGFGLHHTTEPSTAYPFDKKHNGFNIAFDQQAQSYMTYKYINAYTGQVAEVLPMLYPYLSDAGHDIFNAFTSHSDYFTQRIQQFLRQKLRWQPNALEGEDIEDHGFAGDGYYQRWSDNSHQWETLTEDNFAQFYPTSSPYELAHQRDVPVYWINASILTMPNGQLHPYSTLKPIRTRGHLPAPYHNLITATGRPYNDDMHYALKVTYATQYGLLTEHLQAVTDLTTINLNLPDKGELVKLELAKINTDKQLDKPIYTYNNPNALANRLFSQWDSKSPTPQLTLDDYWQGSKLFWSATDTALIDMSTGKIDKQKITQDSMLCAIWVKDGQRQKQYFSLRDPWGEHALPHGVHTFSPINHLEQVIDKYVTPIAYDVESESLLLSDAYINQTVDISAMQLPEGQYTYWLTLLLDDGSGQIQEQVPQEQWMISRQGERLSIIGNIDSTPKLTITGLKVYIDRHLQDDIHPNTLILNQNTSIPLSENTQWLDYNRPVVFNQRDQHIDLIAAMDNTPLHMRVENDTLWSASTKNFSAPLTL